MSRLNTAATAIYTGLTTLDYSGLACGVEIELRCVPLVKLEELEASGKLRLTVMPARHRWRPENVDSTQDPKEIGVYVAARKKFRSVAGRNELDQADATLIPELLDQVEAIGDWLAGSPVPHYATIEVDAAAHGEGSIHSLPAMLEKHTFSALILVTMRTY